MNFRDPTQPPRFANKEEEDEYILALSKMNVNEEVESQIEELFEENTEA